MKSATLIAAIAFTAMAGGAFAQNGAQSNAQTTGQDSSTSTGTGANATGMSAPTAPADHNQAVTSTTASTVMPAHGANSFTMKQARRRIAHHGFTQVKDLTKDDQGVWHGTAMQNGAPMKVWEDYKGSVGTE